MQLVGSAPQQAGRSSAVEEMAEARLTTHAGAVHPHRQPPKSQCTVVGGGGSPPSSPDRGHWTLMGTPLQVRLQAIGINAGATEGVGRRSSWLLQDWICQSSSQLIQEWR